MDKIKKIKELVQVLNKARQEYYQNSNEIMTNKQYDQLFDELEQLEKETNFILNNSPTQNVGYEVKDKITKITHPEPMLSLDKTKQVEDLQKFLKNKDGILSWKLDGLTIVLTYNNGELQQAVTRGNGIYGSDITHLAKQITNLPKTIPYKNELIVRGECLIKYSDFERINVNNEYQNARNLASGTLKSLDSKIAKERNLTLFVFNLVKCNIDFNNSFENQLKWLQSQGFDTVEYKKVNKDNISEIVEEFKNNIINNDFPSDGLVLVYNDIEYRDNLGSTSHHPLGWYAFKWQDTTKETTLRDIEWSCGRTGVLTPIAIFDTVELEGTTVSRASLHNISILKGLDLGIGDSISVYKANMIIPQIDENLTKSNTYQIPKVCPICGNKLEIEQSNSAEFLMCNNPLCSGKSIQKYKHFCSRNAMDIEGLSEKILEKLIEKGFIKSLIDIFKLEQYKQDIISLNSFGIKSYNNLISSIEKSKKAKLVNFIFALGIDQIGLETAKLICIHYNYDLKAILKATIDDLTLIDGIGLVTAKSFVEWLKNENNTVLLNELIQYVEFEQEEVKNIDNIKDNFWKGKKVYCTGKFANYKKQELKDILEKLGATFSSGYAKSLDILVVGSLKGSSKEDKAKKDGVTYSY